MPTDNDRLEVFALHGVTPEVMAYAMAKYSRSALSMRAAISEINGQKAKEFLNTFYFGYGHRSIADLAHFPMAVENLSLLAAIEVVDEQRWDGQERSTRYQDFGKREYYKPAGLTAEESTLYDTAIHRLFDGYEALFAQSLEMFRGEHPQPQGMDPAAYERTLRARAFDEARYLLPMATLTSVGQILNARTLEGQVSRMLASGHAEVRNIADELRAAASTAPAFNPNEERIDQLLTTLEQAVGGNVDVLRNLVMPEVVVAPTLLKHAAVNTYKLEVERIVRAELAEIIPSIPSVWGQEYNPAPVALISHPTNVEEEIAATLLYQYSHKSFAYWLDWIVDMSPFGWLPRFMTKIMTSRGVHDELLPAFRSSGGFIFDIEMDIGGMRDMHRHRRCIQIAQPYSLFQYATPEPAWQFLRLMYRTTLSQASQSYEKLRRTLLERGAEATAADYLLPLAAKRRFLMKMDIAEMAYIAQLRTQPAGHISYRRVAWGIFKHLEAIAPNVASGIRNRVTDPDAPLDFFKR